MRSFGEDAQQVGFSDRHVRNSHGDEGGIPARGLGIARGVGLEWVGDLASGVIARDTLTTTMLRCWHCDIIACSFACDVRNNSLVTQEV